MPQLGCCRRAPRCADSNIPIRFADRLVTALSGRVDLGARQVWGKLGNLLVGLLSPAPSDVSEVCTRGEPEASRCLLTCCHMDPKVSPTFTNFNHLSSFFTNFQHLSVTSSAKCPNKTSLPGTTLVHVIQLCCSSKYVRSGRCFELQRVQRKAEENDLQPTRAARASRKRIRGKQ